MNRISWLHSSLGALCRGSIHKPVLGQVPRPQTCLAVGSGPFLLHLEVNYPEELGGRGRWIDGFSPRTPPGDRWGGPARKTLGGVGVGNWTQTPGKMAVTTNTALCPQGPDP